MDLIPILNPNPLIHLVQNCPNYCNGKLWRMNAYSPVESLASLELTEEMTRIG